MKKAIQFGAGNIGRGFIGAILSENNYEVCFADINEIVISELNNKREYTVEVVGQKCKEIIIKNVCGVLSNGEEILEKIKEAEIITTAVGPNVLKIIAKTLATGLEKRKDVKEKKYLNIIACENMIKGTTALKEEIFKYLSEEAKDYVNQYVGFPDSAVDRIVPPMEKTSDILKVRVEEFNEWIVDKTQFKGEIPELKGMTLTDNLMAFIERKLFTLNTGHAITAYLGVEKGYRTIKESIEDKNIREIVLGAMKESGEVLIKRYGFDREKHYSYINKILGRFENPYLVDEVVRVGREPLRKLSFNDRLIKPLRGTLEYETKNENLILGIAAAFNYRNESDIQAVELEKKLNEKSFDEFFYEVTGLNDKNIEEKVFVKYKKAN
ncbi:MAG: mannitol-1-phosphate 5-dehydrogenase [Fusobacterium mortiferum]|uniref:mannitol-1-phosphate 5-dehydrogenase n=1 Tax=Fusobacterium mortiferum TaxID=850 RepID=UPI001F460725|nr:mannitol-1-phosphate 5-dehydrogenase [Fusobacterium mortiferum]MCF2699924.1 mannitol-1-phosphate 5-dehydrogenase [Fusobacterium mortiferum]MDY2801084.1 mannitol-1-phosphate 5-dehydrogenase [Fusobacterium mortiferum]